MLELVASVYPRGKYPLPRENKGSDSGGLARIYMKSFILQQMFCFVIRKLSPHKKLVKNALQT
jgi:hypothetical protein